MEDQDELYRQALAYYQGNFRLYPSLKEAGWTLFVYGSKLHEKLQIRLQYES